MKKSLLEACKTAQVTSMELFGIPVRVLDKKGCKAKFTMSTWQRWELHRSGWNDVATYLNGELLCWYGDKKERPNVC